MNKYFIVTVILILAAIISFILIFGGKDENTQTATPATPADSLTEEYRNDQYTFSFRHATTTRIEEVPGEGGQTMLVTDSLMVGSTTRLSTFQIYITPFDEDPSAITEARLKKEIPDLTIRESKSITVGNIGKGLSFISLEGVQQKREIWFAANGHLYQVSTLPDSEEFLNAILATWGFN